MSETRRPYETFTRRLLLNDGKKEGEKCIKYELFAAKEWALVWSPGDRRFFPAPPSPGLQRKEFWETMVRVRINGRWYKKKADYHFLTREEVAALLLGDIPAAYITKKTVLKERDGTKTERLERHCVTGRS